LLKEFFGLKVLLALHCRNLFSKEAFGASWESHRMITNTSYELLTLTIMGYQLGIMLILLLVNFTNDVIQPSRFIKCYK
jgi:hypothetical protein